MYDCWLLELKNINGLPNSDVCKSLSKCISYWYKKTRLTDEDVDNAMTFIAELTLIILQKAGLSVELHAFGSLTSGFGATNSDFDLCIKKVGVDLLDKVR
jgi:DNA polymerase sigma